MFKIHLTDISVLHFLSKACYFCFHFESLNKNTTTTTTSSTKHFIQRQLKSHTGLFSDWVMQFGHNDWIKQTHLQFTRQINHKIEIKFTVWGNNFTGNSTYNLKRRTWGHVQASEKWQRFQFSKWSRKKQQISSELVLDFFIFLFHLMILFSSGDFFIYFCGFLFVWWSFDYLGLPFQLDLPFRLDFPFLKLFFWVFCCFLMFYFVFNDFSSIFWRICSNFIEFEWIFSFSGWIFVTFLFILCFFCLFYAFFRFSGLLKMKNCVLWASIDFHMRKSDAKNDTKKMPEKTATIENVLRGNICIFVHGKYLHCA